MKSKFILFPLILFLIGCTNSSNEIVVKKHFILNGKGFLKFHSSTKSDSIDLIIWYLTFLPFNHEVKHIVTSDTLLEIDTNFPVIVNINKTMNEENARLMILPNDILTVNYDQKRNKRFSACISFEGETESISNYLTNSKLNFNLTIPLKDESPINYNQRIDSLTQLAKNHLKEFAAKMELPSWFLEYEGADIHFVSERLKLVQYQHRYELYKQFIEREEISNSMTDKFLAKNEWITDNLFAYLSTIRSNKYDTLLNQDVDVYLQYTQDNIDKLRGKLTPTVMSYIIAAKLSHLIDYRNLSHLSKNEILDKSKEFDSILNHNTPLISDSLTLNFLKDYKAEQLNKVLNKLGLNPGEKAPFFSLKDLDGKNVELSDFKAKVICLNFWNVYCSPCISSIPMENQLCEKYNAKDFVLVNICTDNNDHQWRKIISDKKFKGIHLRCIDNWAHTLTQKYIIESYPHITLINRQGNIIKNNVNRDSIEYCINKFVMPVPKK